MLTPAYSIDAASLSHPGRIRDNNEDCLLLRSDLGLYLLADGMGGYQAGEVASKIATDAIAAGIEKWSMAIDPHAMSETEIATDACEALRAQVARANCLILDAARDRAHLAGMGTTLAACLFLASRVVVAHVGDSRVYRLRGGSLEQLTRDHSFVQAQLESGLITREEAVASPHRGVLSRALGTNGKADPDIRVDDIRPGDLYLMCCDGLTDMVPDERIRGIVAAEDGADPVSIAARLVRAANEGGGRDNISVIVLRPVCEPLRKR